MVLVGCFESDDALCLFGAPGEAILAESVLYFEQVLKLLDVSGLLLQLHDAAHYLQPHLHHHTLQPLQPAQRLLLQLKEAAYLLALARV